ncbi:hypothetical protein UFOVP219_46 [uncultured Caudovirales phage]|uniref:Uncharacterized protein n=1 Tax=uncultured Caudovirales phage TaxID=2100421 RepID=A0A6J7WLM2_9CAUD|nr:hypothetical protein UFOVP219_46 [uncultured Caudovirales phage]
MAIVTGQLSVSTSAVAVNVPNVMPLRVHLHNNDNTNNLLVGNANVTSNTGMILPKLDSLDLTLNPNEVLYVLASTGTITVSYLVQSE